MRRCEILVDGTIEDASPFYSEKNTNWEGGWRVPSMVRWPGKIAPNSVSNEIMQHMDWLPTLLAAAGNDTIKEDLKAGGVQAIGREYKVHLDGYNFLPHGRKLWRSSMDLVASHRQLRFWNPL